MYVKHKSDYIHLKTGRTASAKIKEQIKSVYVPPGYSNVVYVLSKKLLATGVDSKGRTQYIYSNQHKNARSESRKRTFLRVYRVIHQVEKKIKSELDRKNLVAIVLRLICLCHFRVGHTKSLELNHFGTTTLLKKHFKIKDRYIEITFVGKKGVVNSSKVRCQKTVKQLRELLKHKNSNDRVFEVSSRRANEFLAPFGITSKDLRTYYANVEFAQQARKLKNVTAALQETSKLFHNTPQILKSSYIVPNLYKYVKSHLPGELHISTVGHLAKIIERTR